MSTARGASRDAVAAVDVGGTTIKAGLVEPDGTVTAERVVPTGAEDGPATVVERLRAVVRDLVHDGRPAAVGVVVPGAVDATRGVAVFSANLGWRDVALRELLAADTALPVALGHDVAAAGLADATFGATAGTDESLLVVIGTGIAAVLRSCGRVVRGAGGLAGELGHVPVDPDGEPCPCGQRGCLERYASAAAVSRAYAARGGRAGVPAAEIADLALTDDAAAAAWQGAVDALAVALASATMLLDPAVIALAGGLAEAGDRLLAPLRASFAGRVRWRPPPPVACSPLGARAGLLGAALLARQPGRG
jgi:glucokinase